MSDYRCGDTIIMVPTTAFGAICQDMYGVFIGDAEDSEYDYEVWLTDHNDPISVLAIEIEFVSRNDMEGWVYG